MNRRKFLKAGLLTLVSALLITWVIPSFRQAVRRIISTDCAKLNVSRNHIDRFLQDADQEKFWNRFNTQKKLVIVFFTYLSFTKSFMPYYNKYVMYRGQITGQFLLSTDFFTNRMQDGENIEYVQFYNPYKQPCNNPFSNLFYPETA
jgi:hypothetical protein